MEIIRRFGYRWYIFYSEQDESKAQEIWAKPLNQDEFESELENEGIDFCYELP
jgi:hypothetical protein